MNPRIHFSAILLWSGFLSGGAVPSYAQWLNYPNPGVPRTRDGKPNLTAPAPKAYDGKPDLSGIWSTDPDFFRNLAKDLKPGDVQMLPWAEKLVAEHLAKDHGDDPMAKCMPPGVPRIDTSNNGEALHPFKIVQTPGLVVLLYETSSNSNFRQVFLDGRPLPKDPNPTWLGYSVGKWDGSTLVVDTTGFNGRAWLDTFMGHPQTETGHVTERFTRRDFGHMDLEITIDDSKAYVKPWTAKLPLTLVATGDLIETVCENDKDREHESVR